MLKIDLDQTQTATRILAQGFFDDPMLSFILPDPENRLEALNSFFPFFVADGIQRGEVILAPDEQGVIIWYPQDIQVFDEQFGELCAEAASTFEAPESAERFEKIGEAVAQHGLTEPHCEVLWLVVLPDARGKGIGGDLLRPVLNYVNQENVGSYLVSSNPRNIPFYERQGFKKAFPIPVYDAISLNGMWRAPDHG